MSTASAPDGPLIAHVLRVAQDHRHALRQPQGESVFEIARDPRRVHLAERRQYVVHLGPLQIDEHALRDAGFLDDFAPRSTVGEFAPFQTARHRLPESRGPAALQQ